jgi:hypothetical protein
LRLLKSCDFRSFQRITNKNNAIPSLLIDPLNMPEQRRQVSRRAKSKASNIAQLLTPGGMMPDNELDEAGDFGNSDSDDPAWTPQDDKVTINGYFIVFVFNLTPLIDSDWRRGR